MKGLCLKNSAGHSVGHFVSVDVMLQSLVITWSAYPRVHVRVEGPIDVYVQIGQGREDVHYVMVPFDLITEPQHL